jgi:hypothetical protein
MKLPEELGVETVIALEALAKHMVSCAAYLNGLADDIIMEELTIEELRSTITALEEQAQRCIPDMGFDLRALVQKLKSAMPKLNLEHAPVLGQA